MASITTLQLGRLSKLTGNSADSNPEEFEISAHASDKRLRLALLALASVNVFFLAGALCFVTLCWVN